MKNEEQKKSTKFTWRFLLLVALILALIGGMIEKSPTFKNHHDHWCDYCRCNGNWKAAASTYDGKEVCQECSQKLYGKDIIDGHYNGN